MRELHRKLGEMEYDGLLTGLNPPVHVGGGTIAKPSEAAVLKRGTLLGKDSSGMLSVYDGSTTPHGILCDDIEIGEDDDAEIPVVIYTAGCFDPEKVAVAEGYTLTEEDKDKLRTYSIIFKAASPAQ